ncbi:MAG TPA: hypothetical protein VMH61_07335 [Candidatus Acidoferrales bacterium]|nr:hypothetical protein [Candidatus Acidoferrales bacterium]
MNVRRLPTLPALLLLLAPAAAPAQETTSTVIDSGRLVLYAHGRAMGSEEFQYERRNDSLFVTAHADHIAPGADGTPKHFVKDMGLIVDSDDFGMRSYTSSERFDGHQVNRTVTPQDTTFTATLEVDGRGTADRLVMPPGRVFVLDGGVYTLFDIVARNLRGHLFGERPVSMLALGSPTAIVDATARDAGPDTVKWGAKRIVSQRVVLSDSTSTFTLWISPEGQLLRLEPAGVDMAVVREPPRAASVPKRRRKPTTPAH